MAEKSEIIDAIEALAVHCRPPLMAVEQRMAWLRDWSEDLAKFPMDAIANACRKWRHSGATKFPTAGQLLPLVREGLPTQTSTQRVQAWGPISDAEFNALSLPDKIRHHRILAHEARRKAGPMWRNGKPATSDEMPDHWRSWNRQAEHHEDESSRLSKHLRHHSAAAE